MTQSGSHDVINFKELAARYDAWYETPLGSLAHALEQEAIFRLAETKPGERTIDIGCGTGIYTLALARRGVHVVGVDPSGEVPPGGPFRPLCSRIGRGPSLSPGLF